ncbi:low temperature requirement protein A [Actinopolymorpha pittospori]|uniref:Low temperature requirement protein LtrA n=1 Tax=Actinopolymorpha pittospori TaxID=648752 RepID=A0A927MTZ2_9ACTN|nr:low temperature requirement protein LtrA [Actinopolymorpha pittospori]
MPREDDRHAGWLELFYDLLFVALVAQLAHPLAEHPSWTAGLAMLLLFLPAWWVWTGSTLYLNVAGEGGAGRRLSVLTQMAALLVMAGAATKAAHGDPALYAAGYAAGRIMLLVVGALKRPGPRAGAAMWPRAASAVLWIVSIPVPPPLTYVLWLAGLVVEIVPWFRARSGARLERQGLLEGQLAVGHLVERFGLFIIIVLGEGIAQIVVAISSADASTIAVVTGLAGFLVLAALWWLYFDFGSAVAEAAVSARRDAAFRLTIYLFVVGHFLPVAALMALAAGLGSLVTAAAEGQPSGDALRLCCLALAVFFLNNALLGTRTIGYRPTRILGWLLPNLAVLTVAAVFSGHLVPAAALALIALSIAIEPISARWRTPSAQQEA